MADATTDLIANRSGCAQCASSHLCLALKHEHADVLGVRVSAVSMKEVLDLIEACIARRKPSYICVTGVHGVMEAQKDPEFLKVLNNAVINTPDGMPMSWVGWLQGFKRMNRVYGPDLMAEVCRLSVDRGFRHFFYGGKEEVAPELAQKLGERYPGLRGRPYSGRRSSRYLGRARHSQTREVYGHIQRSARSAADDWCGRCVRHSHRAREGCAFLDEANGTAMVSSFASGTAQAGTAISGQQPQIRL